MTSGLRAPTKDSEGNVSSSKMNSEKPQPNGLIDEDYAGMRKARRYRYRLSLQWKFALSIGLAFSISFAVVAYTIAVTSANSAQGRLKEQLSQIALGTSHTLDGDELLALTTLPTPEKGTPYPSNAGYLHLNDINYGDTYSFTNSDGTSGTAVADYPTDRRYWNAVNELELARSSNPDSSPYTYYKDSNGQLRFLTSWGAAGYPKRDEDAPGGGKLNEPVLEIVDEDTAGYFNRGFSQLSNQPQYQDALAKWISSYAPIKTKSTTEQVALGVDYRVNYVEEIRSKSLRGVIPTLVVGYVVVMALVVLVSRSLTRRLVKLSMVTARVADGDYDWDVVDATESRFDDEMSMLARSFTVMIKKVGDRQTKLEQQVAAMKVEIDESKRKAAVSEITDTEFFTKLTEKATHMRAQMKGDGPRKEGSNDSQ